MIFSSNKLKGGFNDDMWGVALVFVSLLFDGFVSSETDKNHKSKKRNFAYHSMLYTNSVGLIGNIVFFTVTYMTAGDSTIARVTNDYNLTKQVLLLALCGAIGQIFIYLTISLFYCYKVSI